MTFNDDHPEEDDICMYVYVCIYIFLSSKCVFLEKMVYKLSISTFFFINV